MSRLSPRAHKKIEAAILFPDKKERVVTLSNIGLEGVFLRADRELSERWFAPQTLHNLRINMGVAGECTLSVKVVRNGSEGLGLCFSSVSQGDLLKIWGLIRERMAGTTRCPYCNEDFQILPEECPNCSGYLKFEDKDYLNRWKKKTLLSHIYKSLTDHLYLL